MGLRPAKTIREIRGQPWARISTKKPRKSYVKGAPRPKVRQYNMGTDKRYELEVDLIPEYELRVRDNAIEAARQAANKYLEQKLIQNYFLQVVSYPHLVIREHSALGVAGADRISKGMKLAFGRPKGRMAMVVKGQPVMKSRIMARDLPVLRVAFNRAKLKLGGKYSLSIRDITTDPVNIARKEHVFKKKEEEKPKEEAAPTATTAPAEGQAAAPAVKEEAKKEEKKK